MEPLLTYKDICETLKIGERTAYRLVQTGQLKHTKVGRLTRFKQSDLEKFISGDDNEPAEEMQQSEETTCHPSTNAKIVRFSGPASSARLAKRLNGQPK